MAGLPFVSTVQIDISQDADWLDRFQVVQRDDAGSLSMLVRDANGQFVSIKASPFDLTGYDLEMVIAPSFSDTRAIARLHTYSDARLVVQDAVNGIVAFAVTAAVVATWPSGPWSFIMRAVKSGAYADIMRGPCNIHPRQTI